MISSSNGGSLLTSSICTEGWLWIVSMWWSISLSLRSISRSRSAKAFNYYRDQWSGVESCSNWDPSGYGLLSPGIPWWSWWLCMAPLRSFRGTRDYFGGGIATLTIGGFAIGGGTNVGNVGSWKAMCSVIGKNGITKGGTGVAWMAWTIAAKFWTCSMCKLNQSRPTTTSYSRGEALASTRWDGSFTWLFIVLFTSQEATVLVRKRWSFLGSMAFLFASHTPNRYSCPSSNL